ncbi:MAG: hypothetical protein E6J43_00860 [Chloroflexi bacterium]|nr:MAG: hypothetical protein E6J43_00860 [Chloroflexota bacterium]
MATTFCVGAAVATLVAITWGTAGCFFDDPAPPKPVSNWTIAEARSFDQYDLYWLGNSYQGLPLTSMPLTKDGDGVLHASFFYGEPSLAGDSGGSWYPPLEIDIQPYCGYPPEEHDRSGDSVQIRGVNGYVERPSSREAYLVLWTGDSAINLRTWKSELDIEKAARDIFPIREDSGTTLQRFPAPTRTEC